MPLDQWIFLGSLAFVVAACLNSAHLTRRHLVTSGPRSVRSSTVRILLMVPVYSIESWLALVLRAGDFNKVLALVRKGCESVVVISFVELLLEWLGGAEVLVERLDPGCCRHLPPLSFVLPSWAPASRFVRRTLTGVLQNAVCSLVAIAVILSAWCVGGFLPRAFEAVQTLCLVVMNASQFFAVYCVVTFYHANRELLAPLRPVQKLLSIKGLVFCLFWQEAAVRVAERAGVFDGWSAAAASERWTVTQMAWGLLNFVICVEMFLLSILHRRLYPPGETVRLRQFVGIANRAPCASGAGLCVDTNSEEELPTVTHEVGNTSPARVSPVPSIPSSPLAPKLSLCSVDESLDMRLRGELGFEGGGAMKLMAVVHTPSTQCPSVRADVHDEPALSGREQGWQVMRRLLLALDLSDILRFYRHLSSAGRGSHREPDDQDRELEAFATSAHSATVRNRTSTPSVAWRSRMMVI